MVTYTIVYANGNAPLSDFQLTSQLPSALILLTATIQSNPPLLFELDATAAPLILRWRADQPLAALAHGSVTYQGQRPLPTATPLPPGLSIQKTGPATARVGATILYTLTVTNQSTETLTTLVVFDSVPAGATYVAGGDLVGNFAVWPPVAELAPNKSFDWVLVLTASQTITNSVYAVQSATSDLIYGREPVVTYINEVPPIPTPLPLIINRGAEATWRYNNQPDALQSNPTFNPAQKLYLPFIAR